MTTASNVLNTGNTIELCIFCQAPAIEGAVVCDTCTPSAVKKARAKAQSATTKVKASASSALASAKAFDIKGFFSSMKAKALGLYSKGKSFVASTWGRRVVKAGFAMSMVAVAGTFTTGTFAAFLGGYSLYSTARIISDLIKGNTDWSWKTLLINTGKDLAYVGAATVGYVCVSPFLVSYLVDAAVWVLNLQVGIINGLLNAWAAVGQAIVG